MKKFFFILLTLLLHFHNLSGGEFCDKGLFRDWRFAPLQIDISLLEDRRLVDESTDTFFALGLFILQQKSAVFSIAFIANTLQNNYGIQFNPLLIGSGCEKNYGISFGWGNYSKRCYGIQMGVLNYSWSGKKVEEENEFFQLCGINIADHVFLGLVNITGKLQIGLLNYGKEEGAFFQLGILNYNPHSLIRLMPLLNFDMGVRKK